MTSFAPSNPGTNSPALSPSQGGREVDVTKRAIQATQANWHYAGFLQLLREPVEAREAASA